MKQRSSAGFTAIALIIGLKIVLGGFLRNADTRPPTVEEKIAAEQPPIEIRVNCKIPHGLKEFSAIQPGMTFPQVLSAMHMKGITNEQEANSYLKEPYFKVKFVNPDMSSNDYFFRNGKVSAKQRRTSEDNNAERGARQGQEDGENDE